MKMCYINNEKVINYLYFLIYFYDPVLLVTYRFLTIIIFFMTYNANSLLN